MYGITLLAVTNFLAFADTNKAFMVIAIVVIALIFIGIILFINRQNISVWRKGFQAGISPTDVTQLQSRGIPIDDAVYILGIAQNEGLNVNLRDIKQHYDSRIDRQRLVDVLRISQQEDLGIKLEDLKSHFTEKLDQQKQINTWIDARRSGLRISLMDVEYMSLKNIDVNTVLYALLLAKHEGIKISLDELKELEIEKIDIINFVSTLIKAKKVDLEISISDLKSLYLAREEVDYLIRVMIKYQKLNLKIPLEDLGKLALTKVNIESFIDRLIEPRDLCLDALIVKLDIEDQVFTADLVNGFIVYGRATFEAILLRYAINTVDEENVKDFVNSLIYDEGRAFKVSLLDIKDLSLVEGVDDNLVDAYLRSKELSLNISLANLYRLSKSGSDVKRFVEILEDAKNRDIDLPLKGLLKLPYAPENIVALLNAFIKCKEANIRLSMSDLEELKPVPKNLGKIANIYIEFQTDNIDISLNELNAFYHLSNDQYEFDKFIDLVRDAKTDNVDIPIDAILGLPLEKINTVELVEALIKTHKYGINISDFKKLFITKLNIKQISNVFLTYNDWYAELNDKTGIKPISLLDLEKLYLEKIEVENLVDSYIKLKTEKIPLNFAEVKDLVKNKKIELFSSLMLSLDENKKTTLLNEWTQQKFNVNNILNILETFNLSVKESIGIEFNKLVELEAEGINIENIVKALVYIQNTNKQLSDAEKLKLDFEGALALDKAEFNVLESVKQTIIPTQEFIYPILAITKDASKIVLKADVNYRMNYTKLIGSINKETFESKLKDTTVSVINSYDTYSNVLQGIEEIPQKIKNKIMSDAEFNKSSAYEIVNLSLEHVLMTENEHEN